MQRAIELAELGKGFTSPNPLVGCVIVHHDKIIGEGWHRKYGEAHAEVNAVNSVADKALLRESTVYVTLEPCAHFGKTPPCADLLVSQQVRRVVIANVDPFHLVHGKGIKKLEDAGIEVITGVLAEEAEKMNKRFFTNVIKQRPYIILKWAQTADGFIARENFDSKWISNEMSRSLVHRWRTEEDAVLVGKSTAAYDNPMLNVRMWTGRDPLRIVLDRKLSLPHNLHLFDQSQKTIRYNVLKDEALNNLLTVKLDGNHFVQNVVENLYRKKIGSLIVEGGAQTLQSFIDLGLWDEIRIFQSPQTFDKGIRAPVFSGKLQSQHSLAEDVLLTHLPLINS